MMLIKLQTLKAFTNKSSLFLFNLSTCWLSKNIDHLEHLIKSKKGDFEIVAVSKSKIVKNKLPTNDISLQNYSYEFSPTEASAGSMLIYVSNHLSCKPRNDTNVYKAPDLESIFIEVCVTKNLILFWMYQ